VSWEVAIRPIVLATLLIGSCTGAPEEPTPDTTPVVVPGQPDVLVVVLDTLRQDRVSSYGYGRDTTPVLDALAAQGTRYANARSTSSWTTPAHASLFTGLHPAAHGANQEMWDLTADQVTLAEILSERGYRTIAGVGNPMLAPARGFSQGFQEYHEGWRAQRPSVGAVGGETTDTGTVRWLATHLAKRDDRPQFVFVNLIGIHSPYDSCGESCGRYGAAIDGGIVENGWQDYYLGRLTHDQAALTRLSDLYDAEVREADRHLGEVIAAFEAAAGDRPKVVIVTSDHGENIGDHGHLDHVFTLYESVVRVPLVVRGPGVPVGVDPSPVQLHDVFPTVLGAVGVPLAEHPSQGHPLDEVSDGRTVVLEYDKPVQASRILLKRAANDDEKARLEAYQRHLRGIVDGNDKLVEAEDGLREIYDLSGDPTELTNLAPTRPEGDLDAKLEGAFKAVDRDVRAGETTDVDAETRSALEALGYLE